MLELDVRNEQGEVTGKIAFDESVLGDKVKRRLLHQMLVGYMANKRQGTASTKTRGEVAGAGRKVWRQKGTGRARIGQARVPTRVGGGVAFGPKPRSYRQKLPKKMRREALRAALLAKFVDKEVTVIEPLKFEEPKTKRVSGMMKALGVGGSCLFALREADGNFWKSSRNVPKVSVLPLRELNALDVMKHSSLVLTREVVENLAEVVR